MMASLVMRNPAMRAVPRFLAVALGVATLVINVIAFLLLKERNVNGDLLIALVWLTPALFLVFGDVRTRAQHFDLPLPIPSRKLWLAHMIAVVSASTVILLATIATVGLGMLLLEGIDNSIMESVSHPLSVVVHLIAALCLAAAISQARGGSVHRQPQSAARAVAAVIGVLLGLILVITLSPQSPLHALIPLALAGSLIARLYRQVPVVYSLLSDKPAPAQGASAVDWQAVGAGPGATTTRFQPFLTRSIFCTFSIGVKQKLSPWVAYPITAFIGVAHSGTFVLLGAESLRFEFIPMGTYMLMAFSGGAFANLYLLDSLPISRSRFLAVFVASYVVVMTAGYGVGLVIGDRLGKDSVERIAMIENRTGEYYFFQVPDKYRKISWKGEPADAVSPWGERKAVWRQQVIKGLPAYDYLPATVGDGTPIKLAAWQLRQAIELVYGETIPMEELRERYLVEREDGSAGPKNDRLTIAADYPHLRPIADGPVFPVIMGLTVAFWLVLLRVFLGGFRADVTPRARHMRYFWGALAIALAVWIGQFVLSMFGLINSGAISVAMHNLIRDAGSSPIGYLSIWMGSLLLVAAAYRVALGGLRRAEASSESWCGR